MKQGPPREVVWVETDSHLHALLIASLRTALALKSSDPLHILVSGGRTGRIIIGALALFLESLDDALLAQAHVWLADERYLPEGHSQRNDALFKTPEFAALGIPESNTHRVAFLGEGKYHEAAAAYSGELASFAAPGSSSPMFDVALLGVGEDGHVASLFPSHGNLAHRSPCIAVVDAPKLPPIRVSLSLPTLNQTSRVWLIVTGGEKAPIAGRLTSGTNRDPGLPASLVSGQIETRVFVDTGA